MSSESKWTPTLNGVSKLHAVICGATSLLSPRKIAPQILCKGLKNIFSDVIKKGKLWPKISGLVHWSIERKYFWSLPCQSQILSQRCPSLLASWECWGSPPGLLSWRHLRLNLPWPWTSQCRSCLHYCYKSRPFRLQHCWGDKHSIRRKRHLQQRLANTVKTLHIAQCTSWWHKFEILNSSWRRMNLYN